MDREYDLFEKLPNGSITWRALVSGRDNAIRKLRKLASQSSNEFLAVHKPSQEVIARLNTRKAPSR